MTDGPATAAEAQAQAEAASLAAAGPQTASINAPTDNLGALALINEYLNVRRQRARLDRAIGLFGPPALRLAGGDIFDLDEAGFSEAEITQMLKGRMRATLDERRRDLYRTITGSYGVAAGALARYARARLGGDYEEAEDERAR